MKKHLYTSVSRILIPLLLLFYTLSSSCGGGEQELQQERNLPTARGPEAKFLERIFDEENKSDSLGFTQEEQKIIASLVGSDHISRIIVSSLSNSFTNNDTTETLLHHHAITCKDSFDHHRGRLFSVDTTGNGTGIARLHGWRLNLDAIQDLIPSTGTKGHIKELFLVPIMKPTKQANGSISVSLTQLSIAVAGIDRTDNIIYDGTRPILYEYLKPCPNNCPKGFKELFYPNGPIPLLP